MNFKTGICSYMTKQLSSTGATKQIFTLVPQTKPTSSNHVEVALSCTLHQLISAASVTVKAKRFTYL